MQYHILEISLIGSMIKTVLSVVCQGNKIWKCYKYIDVGITMCRSFLRWYRQIPAYRNQAVVLDAARMWECVLSMVHKVMLRYKYLAAFYGSSFELGLTLDDAIRIHSSNIFHSSGWRSVSIFVMSFHFLFSDTKRQIWCIERIVSHVNDVLMDWVKGWWLVKVR